MSTWFDGTRHLPVTLDHVREATRDHGTHVLGVVERMPGMRGVELLETGAESVVVRTDEGLMTRTAMHRLADARRVVVDCDEHYRAGRAVTATSHMRVEAVPDGDGVLVRITVTDLAAPGPLGFVYRLFGAQRMGKAWLDAYEGYLTATG